MAEHIPFSAPALLLLGEGDFSYAASVDEAVVATAYDDRETCCAKYGARFGAHEAAIVSRGGKLVFGVDATDGGDLVKRFGAARSRAVAFNYPHTGTRSLPANRALLRGALEAGGELVAAAGCTFSVTVKTTGRYNAWAGDLRDAAPVSLRLVGADKAEPPQEYEHATTTGVGKAVGLEDNSVTWTFRAADGAPHAPLGAWLRKLLAREAPACTLCERVFTTEGDLIKHNAGAPHRRRERELKRRKRARAKEDEASARRAKRANATEQKPWYFCDVCGLEANSRADLDNHLAGKRHRATEARRSKEGVS